MEFLVGLADKVDAELEKFGDFLARTHEKSKDEVELERLDGAANGDWTNLWNYMPIALANVKMVQVGIIRASFTVASFYVENAYVDLLRFGEGLKKKTLLGAGEDLLRGLIIVGAALRAARLAGKFVRNRIGLRASLDFTKGTLGNCGWVAFARGMALSGQSLFITVRDLAKALNKPLMSLTGTTVVELETALKQLQDLKVEAKIIVLEARAAARFRKNMMGSVATLESVEEAAKAVNGDVIMINVAWPEKAGGILKNGHMILARWTGKSLELIDRTGKRYRTLAELDNVFEEYKGIAGAIIQRRAMHIPNSRFTKALDAAAAAGSDLMALVGVEVMLAWLSEAQDPPGVLKALDRGGSYVAGTTICVPPKPPLKAQRYYMYTVQSGDTLASIAQRVYNDSRQWQPVREANAQLLDGSADRSLVNLVGKELFIPSVM